MASSHSSSDVPESAITDEAVYVNRRRFLKAMGVGALTASGLALAGRRLYDAHSAPGLTPEEIALRYNNFYEFTQEKGSVWKVARDFRIDPYSLEVGGLVERPGRLTLEQVEALGLEERIYRFRCVETWGMVLPWRGVPLARLLNHVGVKSEARYVAFTSFLDPEQAPLQRRSRAPWPYHEGLRLDEAMHDLTLLATGIYGRQLPPQSGTPLRIVVPWKYGFKGAKSVVRITLTEERPPSFWNTLQPDEYSWLSNVDPEIPHPRYSQAYTRYVRGKRMPTLAYNGYAEQVAHLYRT